MQLSLQAQEDIEQERQRLDKHWQQRRKRARYDVEVAERRYQAGHALRIYSTGFEIKMGQSLAGSPLMESLCRTCANVRRVVSGTGSTFLLCQLSQSDKRFSKYPPQPVIRCDGFQAQQSKVTTFTLEVLPETLAVCRLSAHESVPNWASGAWLSITRTPDELSIVCPQASVPAGIRAEPGWRCLRVVGQLDFSMVGGIAALTGTLASAKISVFVLSTFDTDYLLVKDADLEAAVKSLIEAGNSVQGLADN